MKNEYDVVIIGGGPAGLTAGIYTARDRFSTLIIERALIGGNITTTDDVENYPGFPEGITGFELTAKMHEQATKHGAETAYANISSIDLSGSDKIIHSSEGDFIAKALIIASGTERVKLNVPGEKEFTGQGVSYCATCDGPFFKNKTVAVVGGGNAAVYEAIHLASPGCLQGNRSGSGKITVKSSNCSGLEQHCYQNKRRNPGQQHRNKKC